MAPIRRHFLLGLLTGTGIGVLVTRLLVGVGVWDIGAANFGSVGAAAMLAAAVSGLLYAREGRRVGAAGSGRAEPDGAVDAGPGAGRRH